MLQRFTSSLTDERRFDRTLWLFFGFALLVRIVAVLALDDYRAPLTAEYGAVAESLLAGRGFSGGAWLGPQGPTALNTPVYPAFLAGWLFLTGSDAYLVVELCQAVLSALLVVLAGRIAQHLAGGLTGLITAALVAFFPPFIYFSKQISPAIFTTFFAAWSLYVMLRLLARPGWIRAAGAGAVFGLALLVEPILGLGLTGVAAIEWRQRREATRLSSLFLAAAVAGLIVLPWSLRNAETFDRFVPLKTSFGLNFWLGNNPNATGYLYTSEGVPMQDTLPESTREHLAGLNEADRYVELSRAAWAWTTAHPLEFLRLTARRVVYFWWMSPTYQVTEQNITEPRFFYVLRALIQAPLLALALAGAILGWRTNRRMVVLALWWLVALSLPYVVSVAGNTRYRMPAEPVLLMLAAFFLAGLWERLLGDSPTGAPIP